MFVVRFVGEGRIFVRTSLTSNARQRKYSDANIIQVQSMENGTFKQDRSIEKRQVKH